MTPDKPTSLPDKSTSNSLGATPATPATPATTLSITTNAKLTAFMEKMRPELIAVQQEEAAAEADAAGWKGEDGIDPVTAEKLRAFFATLGVEASPAIDILEQRYRDHNPLIQAELEGFDPATTQKLRAFLTENGLDDALHVVEFLEQIYLSRKRHIALR